MTPLRPIKPAVTAAKDTKTETEIETEIETGTETETSANSCAGWSICKTNPRLLACRLICSANVRRLWAIFQVAGDESSVINLN